MKAILNDTYRYKGNGLRRQLSALLKEKGIKSVEVLKAIDGADAVAAAENNDRKVIYQTIAQQNGLENAVGTIESVFAQVQRDKAAPGDQVQDEDGRWTAR